MAEHHGSFQGLTEDALDFFRELAVHNDRRWFSANADRYQEKVLEPAQALVRALGTRMSPEVPGLRYDADRVNGAGSIFRIQRDVRFAADKSPYKTNLGLLLWIDVGRPKMQAPHFYVGLYADRVVMMAGMRVLSGTMLDAFRRHAAGGEAGSRLASILAGLEAQGFKVGAERLARVPRPYAPTHPREGLLRLRGLYAEQVLPPTVATSPGFEDMCVRRLLQMAPLVSWLAGAVRRYSPE